MMSQLQLRLLGSFQFIRAEEYAVEFRSEKERALLAYLAIEGFRPHSRDVLAGLLWPEQSDAVAHNNLRVTLHRLRQAIGDLNAGPHLLDVSRETIQLIHNGRLWVDVSAFQELLSRISHHNHGKLATCQECMTWYAQAAALYQGEFLQGVYPVDSVLFSEWAALKRERLHLQALQALYLLTNYCRRRGELDLALGYARRQLELEPWREEAHSQVIHILALRGERSAALRQYERCRQVLMEELGIEPAKDTVTLFESILASRKRRRHNLPLQTTPFLGRKSELNQVSEYLFDPDCRLLTILGPGGIGKSRLALQAAEAQIYTYLQGVFLVQLAGITTQADMILVIAGALDLQFHLVGDPKRQLLDHLREKEVLLVLDNFEQLLGPDPSLGIGILEDLLKNTPGVRLLITSRQRLNLSREWVFILHGLPYPENVYAPGLEDYEAVRFFLNSAHRTSPGFQLTNGDILFIVRICQLLVGVPLAIEMAAAWIRVMSPEQILQEIENNLDFLSGSYPDYPERHRSLRATFEHSYNLLAPNEQLVLSRLSIFPDSFNRSAGERIAGASLAILSSLSDSSLLEHIRLNDRRSRPRYRMHKLIKQFSREKLNQNLAEVERTKAQYRSFHMESVND